MLRRKVTTGLTSVIEEVFIQDTSSTFAGLAILYNTFGLVAEYRGEVDPAWTPISLATGTLGSYVSGSIVASGSLTGAIQFGTPNACFFAARGKSCRVRLYGAANMLPTWIDYELDTLNYQAAGGKLPVTLNSTDVTGNLPSTVNGYGSGQDPATLLTASASFLAVLAAAIEGHLIDETDGQQLLASIVAKINATDVNLAGLSTAMIASAVANYLLSNATTAGTLGRAISDIYAGTTTIRANAADGSALATNANLVASYQLVAQLLALNASQSSVDAVQTAAGIINTKLGTPVTTIAGDIAGVAAAGRGNGDIAVDHNYGGTDSKRLLISGTPIDNAIIRAWTTSNYFSTSRNPKPPVTFSGSDGRWIAPLMLDPDDYTIVVFNPMTNRADDFSLTVVMP